ncbi:hypothetical protein [Streptomyces fractus]|uniref:hypothetical protein n=1 Tax=Streptomyces fractus TaxID=641806 RepID=UPI003CFB8FDE
MTVRFPEARDLSEDERGILVRHEQVSIGELCDFCRITAPVRYWHLEPGAVDIPGATVITPDCMYACGDCLPAIIAARTMDQLDVVAVVLPEENPAVRQAMWAAFLTRRRHVPMSSTRPG